MRDIMTDTILQSYLVARIGKMRNAYGITVGKSEWKRLLWFGDLGVDGK
jgi:hypothetical protein